MRSLGVRFLLFLVVLLLASSAYANCCPPASCIGNVGWVDQTRYWCGSSCREPAKGFPIPWCEEEGGLCNIFGCACSKPCNSPCSGGLWRCSRTSCICTDSADESREPIQMAGMTVQETWEYFNTVDTDASGTISPAEFSSYFENLLTADQAVIEFAKLDTNTNELIDPPEFDASLVPEEVESDEDR